MVHRPADSRLLTNLLQHEKDYSKQLGQLLDYSNASLASFAAYAAASPQPASQIIMAVAGSLAAADEALRRYAQSVDQWRETMSHLKDTEDEVGNIMRDREILVTRLIKASKSSQKNGPGSIRDSLLMTHQQFPSSSSLSLTGQQDTASPAQSRPLSLAFSSSSKLAAAQSELQACEVHLAAKERELAARRSAAVRDGLGARVKAMVECGWAWGELGKESLRTLEGLSSEHAEQRLSTSHDPYSVGEAQPNRNKHTVAADSDSFNPSSDFSSIAPSQSASQTNYDAPSPAVLPNNGTSIAKPEALNLDETQKASQPQPRATLSPPSTSASAPGSRPLSGSSTITGSSSMLQTPVLAATTTTYKLETVTYAPAVALHVPPAVSNNVGPEGVAGMTPYAPTTPAMHKDGNLHYNMKLPAAHAWEDYVDIPVATPEWEVHDPSIGATSSSQQRTRQSRSRSPVKKGSASIASSIVSGTGSDRSDSRSPPMSGAFEQQPKRHVLERRITEEDEIRRLSLNSQGHERHDTHVNSTHAGRNVDQEDAVSVESSTTGEGNGRLEVVENPRFMSEARRKQIEREKAETAEREAKDRTRKEKEDLEEETARAAKAAAAESSAVEHGSAERKETAPAKDKKRFPFLGHHRSNSQSTVPSHHSVSGFEGERQRVGSPTKFGNPPRQQTSPPTSSPPKSVTNTSPSKGFLGSLRGFFHAKDKDRSPSKSARSTAADDSNDSDDSDGERSPTKSSGLQNLFRSPGSPKKKSSSVVSAPSERWETRTEKNMKELSRRGSFEGARVAGPSAAGPSNWGLAAEAVAKAGIVTPPASPKPKAARAGSADGYGVRIPKSPKAKERNRASSDVGFGMKEVAAPAAVGGGAARRLKKNRAGTGGPPIAGSATAAAASWLPGPASTSTVTPSKAQDTSTPSRRASARASAAASGSTRRRSVSVGVGEENRRSVIEHALVDSDEEETGGGDSSGPGTPMIVDLGKRRRATSELGGSASNSSQRDADAARQRAAQVAYVPSVALAAKERALAVGGQTAPRSVANDEYASDTAALAPSVKKKKSLSKKKSQGTDPAPTTAPVATSSRQQNSASTPTRQTSTKSTSSPSKASAVGHQRTNSVSGSSSATVLQAGGDHPSGVLSSHAGKATHAQMQVSGGLSRNSSILSSASGGSGGASRARRSNTLGQGMTGAIGGGGGVGRSGSVRSTTSAASTTSASHSKPSGGQTTVVQPAQAAPSLMSIVENVARGNREGWNSGAADAVGGHSSKKPTASMIDVVKAPPRVGREALLVMDPTDIKNRFTNNPDGGTGARPTQLMNGLLEIKAPGSVFDDRYLTRPGSASTADLNSSNIVKPVQQQARKPEMVRQAVNPTPQAKPVRSASVSTGTPSGSVSGAGPVQSSNFVRAPLKSALRNPSPSPSPSPVPGPSRFLHPEPAQRSAMGHPPPPNTQPTSRRAPPQATTKSKAPVHPDGSAEESEADDSASYETGNEVFYSDEEEVERAAPPVSHSQEASESTIRQAPNGHPVANGHVTGYTSEQSESTTSTVIKTGLRQHLPASSTSQAPRRRKSVRVSLQPTFSPSPPAIEYDEEDAMNRRSWDWRPEVKQHTPVVAAPVAIPAVKPKTVSDLWADSSDEDEEYKSAKLALTRAAKKDKEAVSKATHRNM